MINSGSLFFVLRTYLKPFQLQTVEGPGIRGTLSPFWGVKVLRLAEAKSFLEENKTRVPPQVPTSFSNVTPVTQSSGDFCKRLLGRSRWLRPPRARLKTRQVENGRTTRTVPAYASEFQMEMSHRFRGRGRVFRCCKPGPKL